MQLHFIANLVKCTLRVMHVMTLQSRLRRRDAAVSSQEAR